MLKRSRGILVHSLIVRRNSILYLIAVWLVVGDELVGCFYAKVAKLVYALDLGSSAREGVGVRVPPFAPNNILIEWR